VLAGREAVAIAERSTAAGRNRRDVTFAVQQLHVGMKALIEISGARSAYDSDPLQALYRYIVTIGTHTIVCHQGAMVLYGRLMLGLPEA
jgi:hypothetical protein